MHEQVTPSQSPILAVRVRSYALIHTSSESVRMVALLPRHSRTIGCSSNVEQRQAERERLRVSRFDIVSSFLMSFVLFMGTLVLMLVVVWLTSQWRFPSRAIESMVENREGSLNPEGSERDFEPPGIEEVEELVEPALPDMIQAVTTAVSTVAASLVTVATPTAVATNANHVRDSRPPGPAHGEGEQDIIPRYARWQLAFTARDLASYAKQLDFFKIELGAVGGTVQGVDVVNNLAGGPNTYRIVDTESEKRIYFMWNRLSPLLQFDRQLLQQGGVQLENRQILKFIPKELENVALANLELDYARSKGYRSVNQIAKTVFECKPYGGGYRFEVTSQRYRKVE